MITKVEDAGSHIKVFNQNGYAFLFSPVDYFRLKTLGVTNYTPCFQNNKPHGIKIRLNNTVLNVARFITSCPNHLEVDHINRNPFDNRQENLRCVTHRVNCANKSNNTRFPGVCYRKDRMKWLAYVEVKGKRIHLGMFNTQDEAVKVRSSCNSEFYRYRTLPNRIAY